MQQETQAAQCPRTIKFTNRIFQENGEAFDEKLVKTKEIVINRSRQRDLLQCKESLWPTKYGYDIHGTDRTQCREFYRTQ
jgi:hypothetical protein